MHKRRSANFSRIERFLLASLTIVLVGGAATLVLRLGLDDAAERLDARIDVAHELVTQRIANGFGSLSSLAGLHQASDNLNSSEFTALAEQLQSRHDYITSIAYVARVEDVEREEFEQEMRTSGLATYRIHDFEARILRANKSGVHLPVTMIEPMTPYSVQLLGADLNQHSMVPNLVSEAVRSGEPAAGQSTLSSDPNVLGLMLVQPTYYGTFVPRAAAERQSQLSGAFLLSIHFDQLIKHLGEENRLSIGPITSSRFDTEEPRSSLWIKSLTANRIVNIGGTSLELRVTDSISLDELPLHWALAASFVAGILAAAIIAALRHRRRAQVQIERSNELFFDLFDRSVQGIFIHREWTIIYANQSFCDLLGYSSAAELLEKPRLVEHISPSDRERLHNYRRARNDGYAPVHYEFSAVCKDGSEITLDNSVRLIEWHDAPATQCTVVDITERKAAERSLIEVSERALSAARAKSEFLANMSHELRTPLNGVSGMLQMLAASELNGEQGEYISVASASSDTLLSLIDDILDFSRLEAGGLELAPRAIDLQNWLQNVGEQLADTTQAKGVEFVLRNALDTPREILIDSKRLQQVVTNLVSNATKFTDSGAVLVDVSSETDADKDATLLVIRVSDTGIGIETEDHQKIFESFTQVDGSTTRRFGGSGLGLAIAQQLIERMDGTLALRSTPGQGSEFIVKLPVAVTRRPEPIPLLLANVSVACIEPSLAQRAVIEEYLEALGARVNIYSDFPSDPLSLITNRFVLIERNLALGHRQVLREMSQRRPFGVIVLKNHAHTLNKLPPALDFVAGMIDKPIALPNFVDAFRMNPNNAAVISGPSTRKLLLIDDNPLNLRVRRAMLEQAGFGVDTSASIDHAIRLVLEETYESILIDCDCTSFSALSMVRRLRDNAPEAGLRIIGIAREPTTDFIEEALLAGMDNCISKSVQSDRLGQSLSRAISEAA
ncbi:MAG: ATP-binding protein [Pseudomonadota bacterium]